MAGKEVGGTEEIIMYFWSRNFVPKPYRKFQPRLPHLFPSHPIPSFPPYLLNPVMESGAECKLPHLVLSTATQNVFWCIMRLNDAADNNDFD